MRYPLIFAGMSLWLFVAFPALAAPENGSNAATPTATMLARSALLGMQLNVRERRAKGQIAELTMSCIESLDVEELTPTYQSSLMLDWDATTLAATDAFFATPLGEKVVKASLLAAYVALKQVPPEPAPMLTEAEQRELEAFQRTPSGIKLYSTKAHASEASRQMQQSKIHELLQSCGLE